MVKVNLLIIVFSMFFSVSSVASEIDVCQHIGMRKDYFNKSRTKARIKRIHKIPKKIDKAINESIKADIQKIGNMLGEVHEFRSESITLFQNLLLKVNSGKPLKVSDLNEVYQVSKKRLKIRNQLVTILKSYRCLIFAYNLRSFKKYPRAWAFRAASVVLAARVLMDDNYLLSSILYQRNADLRRLLNEENDTYGIGEDSLADEVNYYYSFLNEEDKEWTMDIFHVALDAYRKYYKKHPNTKNRDIHFDLASEIITRSAAYQKRKQLGYGQRILESVTKVFEDLFTRNYAFVDFWHDLGYGFLAGVSQAFGTTISQIQWRDGSLLGNKKLASEMKATMLPGDILWDKTRSKVSGLIIPGFWNHNAIYLGNEEQLKDLGIWDHELIRPYHKSLRAGKVIGEALAPGVVLNTVEHFLNVDDILIARKINISDEQRIEVVKRVFENIGKDYDFNFNTNGGSNIICSELVMIAYPEVDFEQEKLVGKWSTTPDLMSKSLFGAKKEFETLIFYYNSKPISDSNAYEDYLHELLKSEKISELD